MEIKEQASVDVLMDVLCDVCKCSTLIPGSGLQYGRLEAQWGHGSKHAGEHYQVHLCEPCFFKALAEMRGECRINTMFDDDADDPYAYENLGLVSEGHIRKKS